MVALGPRIARTVEPLAVFTNPVAQNSEFGWSVAGSGDLAVVGAPWKYIDGPQIVGEAYVFDLKTGTLLRTLANPNTLPGADVTQDRFANAVALVGAGTVAVGAADAAAGMGHIYLFDASTGELRHTLLPPPGGYAFGAALAAEGNRLLATGLMDTSELRGAAFLIDGDTGELLRTFIGEGHFTDGFGTALAIHGDTVLIGAVGYAHLLDAVSGSLLHRFACSPAAPVCPGFGAALGLTDDRIFVGSLNEEEAYVLDRSTGDVLHVLTNPSAPTRTGFGRSLAVLGANVLVGSSAGAHLFTGGTGRLLETFQVPPPAPLGFFGSPVASAGGRALVTSLNLSGGHAVTAADYGALYAFPAPVCGNGVVEETEECDDGNTTSGDCCSTECLLEPAGARCGAEDDLCAQGTCDGRGVCGVDAWPACHDSGRSTLCLATGGERSASMALWAARGATGTDADLGDPTSTTDYALCVFDASANPLVLHATAPAASTCKRTACWSTRRGRTIAYRDPSGAADGLEKILLRPGRNGRMRINLKARGLRLPIGHLPGARPVRVELRNSEGRCWAASYEGAFLDDPQGFCARSH